MAHDDLMRTPAKRTALSVISSTPFDDGKKKLRHECEESTIVASVTNLNNSSTTSTPNRSLSSSRMLRCTRGIQTVTLETINRYSQVTTVRVRKPTLSVLVQTDESNSVLDDEPQFTALLSRDDIGCQTDEPKWPNPIACNAIGCQTDAPALQEICVGTSQSMYAYARSFQQQEDATCQTAVEDFESELELVYDHPAEDQESCDENHPDSMAAMLNEIAQQYGFDLQPKDEPKKKKKKSSGKQIQIDCLQDWLVNKTYKAVASKVDQKMTKLLEKHLTVYNRKTMSSRVRLMQWTKNFLRQQQQRRLKRKAAKFREPKVIVVRKPARRMPTEEKAIQCDPEQSPKRISIATQWQQQKSAVTTRKTVSKPRRTSKSRITSLVSDTCSVGSGVATRQSMRQTKLPSYAAKQTDVTKEQQQQQREQQGKFSPKSSKSSAVKKLQQQEQKQQVKSSPKSTKPPAVTKAIPVSRSKKVEPAAPKKSRTRKKQDVVMNIHIEETPPSSPPDKKHQPYRSPPRYPSQCSKSTETSFLTPTRIRSQMTDGDTLAPPLPGVYGGSNTPTLLLSPMGRMYVQPTTRMVPGNHRSAYSSYFVPMQPSESIPGTPPEIVYPTKRRTLMHSRSNVNSIGGLVRQKPPDVSIISSQQLYSQIGLAVEKALKNKTLPSLATMYGEPHIEVFNGNDSVVQDHNKATCDRNSNVATTTTMRTQPPMMDQFVCSSGKEERHVVGFQGSQPVFRNPPFHTERSPSLSPIVYQDDDSVDEYL